VRADTFFLFMVTAAIAGLPRWAATGSGIRGHGRVAAGAVLLALAFFCKQTGIIYVALGGGIVLVSAWRRLPAYVGAAGAVGLGGTWLLQRTTDGWFWTYISNPPRPRLQHGPVLEVVRQHPVAHEGRGLRAPRWRRSCSWW
jgi:4-amino-4-deoxy-L-arabinose transferase-like glycosyltransferase